jgi:hypothetical protein
MSPSHQPKPVPPRNRSGMVLLLSFIVSLSAHLLHDCYEDMCSFQAGSPGAGVVGVSDCLWQHSSCLSTPSCCWNVPTYPLYQCSPLSCAASCNTAYAVCATCTGGAICAYSYGVGTFGSFCVASPVQGNGLFSCVSSGYTLQSNTWAVPCPAGSYCNTTLPLPCPAGTLNPAVGANSSSACAPCAAGTYTSTTGSTSCQQCPGGHYCPAGTSSWARLNCGRGNYCPDGSGAPTPCPFQAPPSGGWGALQVQGPAFLVETAHCLNHCFWNFTSGDGMLSKC